MKIFLISNSYKCFSSSKETDEYFEYYGAKKNNIIRYPFTSIKDENILKNHTSLQEKEYLKKKYNIKEKKVVLAVGQFIQRKGFEYLIEAFKDIKSNDSVALYIIGGKENDNYHNLVQKYNLKNIYFIDFLSKNIIFDYCKLADIFVLPTLEDIWGLVINEAMANALPIITTDKCVAGNELVKDGINGFIIPAKNSFAISEKINMIINNEDKMRKMGIESLNIIKEYTIENMAKVHIELLERIKHKNEDNH